MYRPFIAHQQLCKCLSSFLLHSQPQSPTSDQAKRGACSRRKTWQQRSDFCQRNPSEADRTICSQAWPTHVSLQQTASTSLLCATGLKLTFKLLYCVIHSDKTCSTILMLKKKKKLQLLLSQKLGTCLYLVALLCVLEPGTGGKDEPYTLQCGWM